MNRNRIKTIEIEKYKGIQKFSYSSDDLWANQLHLFVAPNGFGKSSFAQCFDNLIVGKLKVPDEHRHLGLNTNIGKLKLIVELDNVAMTLDADDSKNEISRQFSISVINTKTISKTKQGYGNIRATSHLAHQETILVHRIPPSQSLNYRLRDYQTKYPNHRPHLLNVKDLFDANEELSLEILHYDDKKKLSNTNNLKVVDAVDALLTSKLNSNTYDLALAEIKKNPIYKHIFELVSIHVTDENASMLTAAQISSLVLTDNDSLNKYLQKAAYNTWKKRVDSTLKALNPSLYNAVKLQATDGKLVFNLEHFERLSNGQRDILSFLSQMYASEYEVKHLSKKDNVILIIDEIFDYLDDANLITCQYFVSQFIANFKKSRRLIYPIILTHLPPKDFDSYVNRKMKCHYISKDNHPVTRVELSRKLLIGRNDGDVPIDEQNDISKYYFHFHPDDFNPNGELKTRYNCASSHAFYKVVLSHIDAYIKKEAYDPFALCIALRIIMEKYCYEKLDADKRDRLITTHQTPDKLQYAENHIPIPDYFYILGLIYNDCLHTKEWNFGFVEQKLIAQLRNHTISKLIQTVAEKCDLEDALK